MTVQEEVEFINFEEFFYNFTNFFKIRKPFSLEYIIPLSKKGLTILENLAYSCGGCNAFKNDKIESIDPLSRQVFSLFNPITQRWEENFEWSEDDLQIIGTTPIGRATVQLLKINREGCVNLRKLLKLAGLHPPEID